MLAAYGYLGLAGVLTVAVLCWLFGGLLLWIGGRLATRPGQATFGASFLAYALGW